MGMKLSPYAPDTKHQSKLVMVALNVGRHRSKQEWQAIVCRRNSQVRLLEWPRARLDLKQTARGPALIWRNHKTGCEVRRVKEAHGKGSSADR